MLGAIKGLICRWRAWWASWREGVEEINGDNREGDWSEPDPEDSSDSLAS